MSQSNVLFQQKQIKLWQQNDLTRKTHNVSCRQRLIELLKIIKNDKKVLGNEGTTGSSKEDRAHIPLWIHLKRGQANLSLHDEKVKPQKQQ